MADLQLMEHLHLNQALGSTNDAFNYISDLACRQTYSSVVGIIASHATLV